MGIRVSTIIEAKGSEVATIASTATLEAATALLAEHGVGALVVSDDGRAIDGVLSERDIVRRLADSGADALQLPIAEVMTREVVTCGWDTTTDELVSLMTERRIRHVPVVDDGSLVAIISIGDVVKSRMEELTLEADQLQAYVAGTY